MVCQQKKYPNICDGSTGNDNIILFGSLVCEVVSAGSITDVLILAPDKLIDMDAEAVQFKAGEFIPDSTKQAGPKQALPFLLDAELN